MNTDNLGASALPSAKRAGQLAPPPPPTILAQPGQPTGQNNNRKKLQLQFSFQEKSLSDEEENDDEIGWFEFVFPSIPVDIATNISLVFRAGLQGNKC